jgi:3-oxoacyl-[acyl-carrier protein] reductase
MSLERFVEMSEEISKMRTALIWGAGGGIGHALVKHLHNEGWSVYVVTHRPGDQNLTDLTPHVFDANVAVPYEVQMVVTSVSQEVEEVNLSIYAPGDIASTKIAEMGPDAWDQILDANLTGAYVTTHYGL